MIGNLDRRENCSVIDLILISRMKNHKRETKDVLLLLCELDLCFPKERASVSGLAEMRHFWHEFINVALLREAVTVPSCYRASSAHGEEMEKR